MAVRDDFAAGEVLAAADLNDTFASKLPYSYGTATPSTTDSGFLWYDSNSTPAAPKFWDGAAFQALGGGKILQVVQVECSGTTSTTSTSFVNTSLTGSITPTKADSLVLVFANGILKTSGSSIRATYARLFRGDVTGTALSSTDVQSFLADTIQMDNPFSVMYLDSPATTSTQTYTVATRTDGAGSTAALVAGVMVFLEVSA